MDRGSGVVPVTTHTKVHTFWACYVCPASGETYTAADKHTRYVGHPTTTGTTAEVVQRVAERYRAIAEQDGAKA